MISNEAVEGGARVLIEDGRYGIPWEDASEDDRAEAMVRVRAILEAAAATNGESEAIRRAQQISADVHRDLPNDVELDVAFAEFKRRLGAK